MSYQSATPNFDLPQWQESDSFQMDDFNQAFSKIDSDAQPKITASGLLKGDGNGGVTAAVANTDYATTRLATAAYSGLMGTVDKTKLDSTVNYVVSQEATGGWTRRKWMDGTADAWAEVTRQLDFSRKTSNGDTFYTQNNNYGVEQLFPANFFTSVSFISITPQYQTGWYPIFSSLHSVTDSSFYYHIWFGTGGESSVNPVTLQFYLIGRWK